MKEVKIELTFTRAKLEELIQSEQDLIANTQHAFSNAYAPYSGFLVGASVLLENGEIIN